jgi:hypothetical protein
MRKDFQERSKLLEESREVVENFRAEALRCIIGEDEECECSNIPLTELLKMYTKAANKVRFCSNSNSNVLRFVIVIVITDSYLTDALICVYIHHSQLMSA